MLRASCRFAQLLAPVALSCVATADTITYSTVIPAVPIGGSSTSTLPQFDASLGVLRSAELRIYCQVSGTLGFENTSAAPVGVGGYGGGTYVGAHAPWHIGPTGGSPPNPAFIPDAVMLPAYDGTTDYGGASGITHAFTGASGDGGPSQYTPVYVDAQLGALVGTGTLAASVGPMAQFGPNLPPGIVASATLTVDSFLSVRYDYVPFPASICRAAPFSGCPCGNWSATASGCGNSANAAGGNLAATGVASISNDTLSLVGSGMTSSNALYFQGTSFVFAQLGYGDGLRCVTGAITRLGTRTNVGGTSQYPAGGGLPVSVRGGVTAPGTRTYQVSYRDAQNYCTSATFNATNGLAIAWGV